MSMKFLIVRRRTLAVLACALAAAAMFALVNAPAVAEASASSRQLPIRKPHHRLQLPLPCREKIVSFL